MKNIRQFYRVYVHDQIGETVFSQFENLPATETGRQFYFRWFYYLKLISRYGKRFPPISSGSANACISARAFG